MHSHSPKLSYTLVRWLCPNIGGLKCNTDGASRGNVGVSSYGFCHRDWHGDVINVEAGSIGIPTNVITEATIT